MSKEEEEEEEEEEDENEDEEEVGQIVRFSYRACTRPFVYFKLSSGPGVQLAI